jgi:hypothetical protein
MEGEFLQRRRVLMNLDLLKNADAAELRSYIEFLLWHYKVADGFWFIYTSEKFDRTAAEGINERVWDKAGAMAAKEIVKRFGIAEKGLRCFVKALRYYPWHMLIEYKIEERDDEVVLTVPVCPTQEARLKRGLGEYSCREMHRREFISFAKVIDERIQVECCFAPPAAHPKDVFCKWRFYIK